METTYRTFGPKSSILRHAERGFLKMQLLWESCIGRGGKGKGRGEGPLSPRHHSLVKEGASIKNEKGGRQAVLELF